MGKSPAVSPSTDLAITSSLAAALLLFLQLRFPGYGNRCIQEAWRHSISTPPFVEFLSAIKSLGKKDEDRDCIKDGERRKYFTNEYLHTTLLREQIGKLEEHGWEPVRTWWEDIGNNKKIQHTSHLISPYPKRLESGPLGCTLYRSLATKNFYAYLCSLSFLA